MIDILEFMIELKHEYQKKFNDYNNLDVMNMIRKLNYNIYNNFEKCVVIIQKGEFVLLKYSLIKGGENDIYTNPNSIYRNCRGTVVNMDKEELVLFPFRKFFNVNEIEECSLAVVMDKMSRAKLIEITNKMDGSMLSMRYYNNDIFIAGTGSMMGGEVDNPRLPKAQKYISDGHKQMCKDYSDYTFMFELILFDLPQIVQYSQEQQGIYLIGARNINTGETLTYHKLKELADSYHIKMTEFETHSFNEIMNMRKDFTCQEKEGWVIRVDDNLYKLKCEDYLNMHKLVGTSPNIILQAWLAGVLDDEKSRMNDYMKSYVEFFEKKFKAFADKRMEEVKLNYAKFVDLKTDKEFGLAVQQSNLDKQMKGFMFVLRKGKELNLFRNVRYNDILKYLGEV